MGRFTYNGIVTADFEDRLLGILRAGSAGRSEGDR